MGKTAPAKQDSISINVRVSGALRTHVERTTTEGDYESVSEYVRDLIRRDKAAREDAAFGQVKAHLRAAFAVPRADYRSYTPEEIRAMAAALPGSGRSRK